MAKTENLYFIAILPPEPERSEILKIKQYFADEYNSKAALKSPPHITLHMPFKLPHKREAELLESLTSLCQRFENFEVELSGFGAFVPRVIFIDVKTSPSLLNLQSSLMKHMKVNFWKFNANYKDEPFKPHLTVAFRDLKKEVFYRAWREFENRSYEYSFPVGKISLLKHNGEFWELFSEMPLCL